MTAARASPPGAGLERPDDPDADALHRPAILRPRHGDHGGGGDAAPGRCRPVTGHDPSAARLRLGRRWNREPGTPRRRLTLRELPQGERALNPLLVMLLLLVLVAKPLVELGLLPRQTVGGMVLLTILAGLVGLAPAERRFRSLLMAGCIGAMGLLILAIGSADPRAQLPGILGAMLALSLLASAVLRQSLASGRITLRRIQGAIAAYLLIGLVFACAYDLVATFVPGAFAQNGQPLAARVLSGDFVFFSFVTLTSTGYGDMVPVHPVARTLAMLELLTGQLYLAVVIARLVSLEIADRGR
ncbi:two pore domain potassium channel family protein [Roseicella aquatilis]|uniref:Two pore domain potassium channel family protein n=1 Tax=Roseicella aquatilis TaxID=2527868 RepID=A0A4R4D9B0_9PROT|nr:two pore domain potassium channel family protein [Roseicella aquatilis]